MLSHSVCPALCDPMDCSTPGSSVRGIFQARILEWVAISFSRGSSWPRDWTQVSCISRQTLYTESPGKPTIFYNCRPNTQSYSLCGCLVAKSCVTLCNPMDCSLPGSSVHGISETRILEWVSISFSRGSSWPRDWTHISCIGRWILYHWATREALNFGLFLTRYSHVLAFLRCSHHRHHQERIWWSLKKEVGLIGVYEEHKLESRKLNIWETI